MTIRAVLLDFSGTVVHEDDAVIALICEEIRRTATVAATAREIGRFWWEQFSPLCDRSWGDDFIPQREAGLRTLATTIRRFGSSADPEKLIEPQFHHWRAPPLFADAVPFLAFLRDRGLPVCVISNIDRADIEAAITHHDLRFDGLVTSDDARADKPRPEMFRMGLDLLGLEVGDVLHVGDSRPSDIVGARNLSIPVAWVNRSHRDAAGQPQADLVVASLGALIPLIGREQS